MTERNLNAPNEEVYDIEVYPNIFLLTIADLQTRKICTFEISDRKDQRKEMIAYLRNIVKRKAKMGGFNNIGFDYVVLHHILTNQNCTVIEIYDKAMSLIKTFNPFGHAIRQNEVLIPQFDIYKICHYDNKAKATSLKLLEFNMRSKNIEDLPFPVGKVLDDKEKDELIKYNKHDVKETIKFIELNRSQIEFRAMLTEKYGKNFTNFNDTKIGKEYFIMELNRNGVPTHADGKPIQTIRSFIRLSDCVFDYVKFDRPEFKALHNWFKKQVITETKGVFSDILESDLGEELAKYSNMVTKKRKLEGEPTDAQLKLLKIEHPKGWLEPVELKSGKISHYWMWNVAETLNVVVNGFQYDYGVGGIHGAKQKTIHMTNDDVVIKTYDVASYYPNLAIKNKLYPAHLSVKFCEIYEYIYNLRKTYGKKTAENAMLKLALNGTYGASNDVHSPFYDPQFTMSITINGQLLLSMLAEKLLTIDGLEIIMANTDGLEYKVPRQFEAEAHQICCDWEKLTGLTLEGDTYSKMFIMNVNNYIAVTEKGKLKNKGSYCWKTWHHDKDDIQLQWHQNHSKLVVPYAVERHLVYGEDIETVIRNHDNWFDFMLRTKVPRSSKLTLLKDGMEEQLQNICRYYVSTNGGSLTKIMPPLDKPKIHYKFVKDGEEFITDSKAHKTLIKKGWVLDCEIEYFPERRFDINSKVLVTPCNDMDNFNGNINYDWYIAEAKKLVDMVDDCVNMDEEIDAE